MSMDRPEPVTLSLLPLGGLALIRRRIYWDGYHFPRGAMNSNRAS